QERAHVGSISVGKWRSWCNASRRGQADFQIDRILAPSSYQTPAEGERRVSPADGGSSDLGGRLSDGVDCRNYLRREPWLDVGCRCAPRVEFSMALVRYLQTRLAQRVAVLPGCRSRKLGEISAWEKNRGLAV